MMTTTCPSIDAAQMAFRALTGAQRIKAIQILSLDILRLCPLAGDYFMAQETDVAEIVLATPPQWCEAILKASGRWEAWNKLESTRPAAGEIQLLTQALEEQERDESREWVRACMESARIAAGEIQRLTQERDELKAGIIATLEENRHLADGEICTLATLKKLVPEWK